MDMLTTNELAERYPVPDADSVTCWMRLLDRWRVSSKLKAGDHYRIRRGLQGRPSREYQEVRVLRLVCQSETTFAESVRIYHGEAIKGVLERVKETAVV